MCVPPPPTPSQADICQLGMDQRKVNMLAREYCDDCKPKRLKPVILSHPMLPGLLQVRRARGGEGGCGRRSHPPASGVTAPLTPLP